MDIARKLIALRGEGKIPPVYCDHGRFSIDLGYGDIRSLTIDEVQAVANGRPVSDVLLSRFHRLSTYRPPLRERKAVRRRQIYLNAKARACA